MKQPSYVGFEPNKYAWKKDVNYREKPHLYSIGKGQQGVLTCEPYKSEIGQHWRFKTPSIASKSSAKILKMFYDYLEEDDFVGADMAKNFFTWDIQDQGAMLTTATEKSGPNKLASGRYYHKRKTP